MTLDLLAALAAAQRILELEKQATETHGLRWSVDNETTFTVAQALIEMQKDCVWSDAFGCWDTSCGSSEHRHYAKFCPNCGGKVKAS